MRDMIAKGRQAFGSQLNHCPQNGEKNNAAKLSDAEVEEMRQLFDSGRASQADLMRKFGTTRANVHLIVRRKSRVVGFDTAAPALISEFVAGNI